MTSIALYGIIKVIIGILKMLFEKRKGKIERNL